MKQRLFRLARRLICPKLCLLFFCPFLESALAQESGHSDIQLPRLIASPPPIRASLSPQPPQKPTPPPGTSRLDSIKTATDIAGSFIQMLALFVGGIFAYYKFFRGRTFYPRLEPMITSTATTRDNDVFLNVCCKLKNVGLSRVDLDRETSALRVFLKRPVPRPMLKTSWWRVAIPAPPKPTWLKWSDTSDLALDVFAYHDWVESGETIADAHLIRVPGHSVCRLELLVVRKYKKSKKRSGKPTSWRAHMIVDNSTDST